MNADLGRLVREIACSSGGRGGGPRPHDERRRPKGLRPAGRGTWGVGGEVRGRLVGAQTLGAWPDLRVQSNEWTVGLGPAAR